MGNTVGPGKSFESAEQRDAGETPMNRKDEQTASKTQSETERLLSQEIRSLSIEIPLRPNHRWLQ